MFQTSLQYCSSVQSSCAGITLKIKHTVHNIRHFVYLGTSSITMIEKIRHTSLSVLQVTSWLLLYTACLGIPNLVGTFFILEFQAVCTQRRANSTALPSGSWIVPNSTDLEHAERGTCTLYVLYEESLPSPTRYCHISNPALIGVYRWFTYACYVQYLTFQCCYIFDLKPKHLSMRYWLTVRPDIEVGKL